MSVPSPTCLEVATDSELIDELGRRCVGLVVAMSKTARNPPACDQFIFHRGNWHAAIGLAVSVGAYFRRQVRKD